MTAPAIVPAADVGSAALGRFYERMYPTRAEEIARHWRWLYRAGAGAGAGAEGAAPIVAVDAGEVVGHAGAIPVRIHGPGVDVPATWFVDFAVVPEAQGSGVGRALAEARMDGAFTHISYPNERSMPVFHRLGWTDRPDTWDLRLFLQPAAHPRLADAAAARGLGAATRIVTRLRTARHAPLEVRPADAAALAEHAAMGCPAGVHVRRDDDFLDWRVTSSPQSGEYLVLRTDGASVIGRVVDDAGHRRLHLLSVRTVDAGAFSDALPAVLRWALEERVAAVWLVSSDVDLVRRARRWLPMRRTFRFAFHSRLPEVDRALRGAVRWEALDSDFDALWW